jgi:hypothetical protein
MLSFASLLRSEESYSLAKPSLLRCHSGKEQTDQGRSRSKDGMVQQG